MRIDMDEQLQHIRERELQYFSFNSVQEKKVKVKKEYFTRAREYLKEKLFTFIPESKPFGFSEISLTRMGIIVLTIFLLCIALLTIGLLRLIR